MKKFFKRFSALAMACMLFASMTVISASAANTTDVDYYKSNMTAGSWGTIASNYKENTSKVYVYPSLSPDGRTMVQTLCFVGGLPANKTGSSNGYVVLLDNSKYAISNWVYEDGDYATGYGVRMWLRLTPYAGSGTLKGVWSPDWTGTGTGVTIV